MWKALDGKEGIEMTNHGNICNINGAEVEPYPIAVTKSRFKEVPCEQNASK